MSEEIAAYDAHTLGDITFASELSRILSVEYPGHKFYVHVNSAPTVGMVIIQHWMLSEQHGYMLKLADLYTHDAVRKAAIKAGGEILERFSVRRGKADMDQLHTLELKSRFN